MRVVQLTYILMDSDSSGFRSLPPGSNKLKQFNRLRGWHKCGKHRLESSDRSDFQRDSLSSLEEHFLFLLSLLSLLPLLVIHQLSIDSHPVFVFVLLRVFVVRQFVFDWCDGKDIADRICKWRCARYDETRCGEDGSVCLACLCRIVVSEDERSKNGIQPTDSWYENTRILTHRLQRDVRREPEQRNSER